MIRFNPAQHDYVSVPSSSVKPFTRGSGFVTAPMICVRAEDSAIDAGDESWVGRRSDFRATYRAGTPWHSSASTAGQADFGTADESPAVQAAPQVADGAPRAALAAATSDMSLEAEKHVSTDHRASVGTADAQSTSGQVPRSRKRLLAPDGQDLFAKDSSGRGDRPAWLSELTTAPKGLLSAEKSPAGSSTAVVTSQASSSGPVDGTTPDLLAASAAVAAPSSTTAPEPSSSRSLAPTATAAQASTALAAPTPVASAAALTAPEPVVAVDAPLMASTLMAEPSATLFAAADEASAVTATLADSATIDGPPPAVHVNSITSEIPSGPVVPATPGSVPEVVQSDPVATVQTGAPNKITIENAKQGTPRSEWAVDGDGDANIQGFATQISTNIGGTVDFKIATDSTHYRLDIYRMGYYGGDGARKVATIDKSLTSAQVQPHPIVDMSKGLIDAGNWSVSASWQIPSDAVSGVYFAKLVREDGTEGSSIVPFIVRDDGSTSDIVFQTSDTTWQAYNAWGGASLYFGEVPVDPANMIGYLPPNCSCGITAIGRATAVSYNRPIVTNTSPVGGTHDYIFGVEASAIQWLEQNGYDVSYISGVDTARSGAQLMNHDAFLSVGHDEYWSAEQRDNVEAARDAGVNLAFWGGNDMYWKVRWDTSIDGSGTPYRTMVTYKDTWGTTSDPTGTATGTWRDPNNAAPGQEPENALIGTMFQVDAYRQDAITVGYDYSNLRFWRNTDVADLQPGESVQLSKNILGYEWNSDVENGYRPAGLVDLSQTTVPVDTYLRDYGSSVGSADATHSLTMYRADSGALVFSAGTVFWSWGLNADHEGPPTDTDPNVQQAMVNMFADMGIQPSTLDASLVLATQSTDHTKPTSTITSPNVGSTFSEGQHVTITGTAQDNGGGVIAGVEVSTDGGEHWFKATGRTNWSFDWVVQASGTYTILSRAVDDSLNLETPSAGKQVSVTLPSETGLWTMATKPTLETARDRDGVELGVRFQTTNGGLVEGIRFYKGFYNIGSHEVSLWTANGTLLATGVATDESLSGWQTVKFSTPVAIAPGTTYVASYHSDGFYSVDDGYFNSTYSNGQVTVQPGGGVFAYGDAGTFPTNVPTGDSSGANYWVDVLLDAGPNTAPTAADDTGLLVEKNLARTFSIAALLANDNDPDDDALKITAIDQAMNGTVSFDQAAGTVTFTPTAGYSGSGGFRYTISDGRGGTSQANVAVTIDAAPVAVSVFQPTDGPSSAGEAGGQPLELGMKFVSSTDGTISAIKFYKAAGDTGSHTGSLWSATGTRLATVTFVNETASGWQTAVLSNPVQVTAGTTYVASYHTTGTYVSTSNYFSTAHTSGSLTAPSSASSGGNGLYAYSSSSVFPTGSYNASNYWVDVVFNHATENVDPVAVNDNGLSVMQDVPHIFAFSELLANDTDANGDALTITAVSDPTNGTVQLDTQAATITFTPTSGYAGPASFTYTVSDGHGGSASANASMLIEAPSTTASLYGAGDTPTVTSVNDGSPVELGVKFVASAAGTITGIRYYKSAQETGTHTGSLWSSNGTLLATVTFSNESASGWQTATFSQPVAISAGTTYVASYQSNGSYAVSANYFSTSHSSGPLTAPASGSGAGNGNGVYAYGSGNEFPNQSYNASNYWVDVVYQPATGNLAPVATNDSGLTTPADTALVIQASTLLANDSDANGDTLTVTGVGNASNGSAVFNAQSNTITFTPTAGYSGAAGFSYAISDGHGGSASAQVALSVLPQGGQSLPQSIFSSSTTPAIVSVADTNPVNLGMKFQTDVSGWITDIRFYKAADNTGTHTGYLWSATGTPLASVTFTNETASGWQQATLDTPVAVNPGTTYVVSYSTNGHYSATPQGLSSQIASGDLRALSSALSGGNGVYAYGSAGAFPTSSYNDTNYHVDVVFRQQLAA